MWFFFALATTLIWGLAELFYKKGARPDEKYAHLKTCVCVGAVMGLHALFTLLTQDISYDPVNLLRYLPVSLLYIISMAFSFFGMRFLEESISDPIENTSGAIVPILTAIFLHEEFSPLAIAAIVVVAIGILCVGFFDKKGKEDRNKNLGKKLAVWAIAMPFCYMILDAVGTFLDIFYTDSVEETFLIGVTEETLEHTANCAYELTFFLVAMGILIFLKAKGEKLFSTGTELDSTKPGVLAKIGNQKWKILAAIFETIGQATYLFALSEGSGVAAVILGAGTVIVSFILSRIFLKEKLSALQYTFIGIIFVGIIMLSFI